MNERFHNLVETLDGTWRVLSNMSPVAASEVPNNTPVGGGCLNGGSMYSLRRPKTWLRSGLIPHAGFQRYCLFVPGETTDLGNKRAQTWFELADCILVARLRALTMKQSFTAH